MTLTNHSFSRVLAFALVGSMFLLSGCQWFGGRASLGSAELRQPIPTDYGAEQLAAGRAALKAGRSSEAIEDFMIARLYSEQEAAAYNGLAVAYSRLGRTDLTERYFRTAIALAPQDERYRSNLAMFYGNNAMPMKNGEIPALAMKAHPDAVMAQQAVIDHEVSKKVPIQLKGGITVETASAPIARISEHEVVVGRRPDAATVAHDPKNSGARVAVVKQQSYPIRVILPEVTRVKKGASSSYPIRIELSDVKGS